jgi:hypothetical protein
MGPFKFIGIIFGALATMIVGSMSTISKIIGLTDIGADIATVYAKDAQAEAQFDSEVNTLERTKRINEWRKNNAASLKEVA